MTVIAVLIALLVVIFAVWQTMGSRSPTDKESIPLDPAGKMYTPPDVRPSAHPPAEEPPPTTETPTPTEEAPPSEQAEEATPHPAEQTTTEKATQA